METMRALDLLVARAKERLSIEKDSKLARHLGLAQDNYISMWRGHVFATEPGEAEKLQSRREALEFEIARMTAEALDLAEQQRRQQLGQEEA